MRRALVGCTIAIAGLVAAAMQGPAALAGGGCHLPATEGTDTTVDMRGACFADTIVRVDQGTTITWTNSDPVEHTVTGAGLRSGESGWGSFEPIDAEGTFDHRFDDAGIYLYYCMLHPSMIGAVVVGDGRSVNAPEGVLASAGAAGAPSQPDASAAGGNSADRGALIPLSFVAAGFAALLGVVGFAQRRRSGRMSG